MATLSSNDELASCLLYDNNIESAYFLDSLMIKVCQKPQERSIMVIRNIMGWSTGKNFAFRTDKEYAREFEGSISQKGTYWCYNVLERE